MELIEGDATWDVHPGMLVSFAAELAPVVAEIRAVGHGSLRGMADELSARGVRTRRGGQWHVSNVRNLVGRLAS